MPDRLHEVANAILVKTCRVLVLVNCFITKNRLLYGYVYLVKTSLAELRTRNSVFSTRQGVTSRYTLAPQNKKNNSRVAYYKIWD